LVAEPHDLSYLRLRYITSKEMDVYTARPDRGVPELASFFLSATQNSSSNNTNYLNQALSTV